MEVSNDVTRPFDDMTTEEAFRNLWTDNADVLSVLNTGSLALKTDFTRNGVRTMKGQLNDVRISAQRFFSDNL